MINYFALASQFMKMFIVSLELQMENSVELFI